ncbi:MAG: cysteine desulfurase [Candidatus Aminicenantes bacterium]|nr:cysteine desulfurase [Candidatus Aminicenantes bacterium]
MDEFSQPIYLDYNATTPHDPEVIAAMRPYLEAHFGNPSSSYPYGRKTREAIKTARFHVAASLNCSPEEIVFTSGGTESNNFAIRGIALSRKNQGRHIITSRIEHPAVSAVCEKLKREGFEITFLPVDTQGLVSPGDVEKAIRPDTILITLMHANNEVGSIQPIEEVSALARSYGIAMHTDAAQCVGKISTDVQILGVDLLTVAGHKVYAPKGVGALYIRDGLGLERLMEGANQENGLRPGTENVLEIVGLGKACEIAFTDLSRNHEHLLKMRDMLEGNLLKIVPGIKVNGHTIKRLPNTLSISVQGVDAGMLLTRVEKHLAISAGAACHSGTTQISHVLQAMQVPEEWALGTLRLSTGRMTTKTEIEAAVSILAEAVDVYRSERRA